MASNELVLLRDGREDLAGVVIDDGILEKSRRMAAIAGQSRRRSSLTVFFVTPALFSTMMTQRTSPTTV
jgi:hypothetical protein